MSNELAVADSKVILMLCLAKLRRDWCSIAEADWDALPSNP